MGLRNADFDVQVMHEGRWRTENVVQGEQDALSAARTYLRDPKCEGARVVRNWTRADGLISEKEIFSEIREARDTAPIRIANIEDAPSPCVQSAEYYGLPSRMLLNRIFRHYLDKIQITPTELLHLWRELKRLQDRDILVPSAVDRVAQLQSGETGGDIRARRDDIFRNIDIITTRARRAETLGLPRMDDDFHKVCDSLAGFQSIEDPDYLALVILARDLREHRTWLGKLDRLCTLAGRERDPRALGLIDGVIADVLGANLLPDLLGWEPNLAQAIIHLLDLAEGRLPPRHDTDEITMRLNGLLADGVLPIARESLRERAHRQLRSGAPLNKADPDHEFAAFQRVAERLLTPDGLLWGPRSAEALTTRQTKTVEEGGNAGRRAAILATLKAWPDQSCALVYLCDLFDTSYGTVCREQILDQIQIIARTDHLTRLTQGGLSLKERLARTTRAHRSVLASKLPEDERIVLAERLDIIVERYLVEERIIEKLDNQESPLRDRAVRLVNFCAAGILPRGRAMNLAREQVAGLLRQPNFDAHFIDGIIDPHAAQKALRDFHALLNRAGFRA